MDERNTGDRFGQAVQVLPAELRQAALTLTAEERRQTEELRFRRGYPASAVLPDGERELPGGPVTGEELDRLLEYASGSSFQTVLPQLRRGFITLPGGHRLGLCGRAVLREGELVNLRPISSASLRIAGEVKGAADGVLPLLCEDGKLLSTLILAPPGQGKTTLLRDVIRCVSEGKNCAPLRVALADERGEVAAVWNGQAQLDVGRRTDVLEGCPKAQGLMLLLRAMNPQVLAVDEITAREDVEALSAAAGCGAVLLATAHGADREDLLRRRLYRPLLEDGLFRRLVRIGRKNGTRCYTVEVL